MKSIVILGSGNVAHHFIKAFTENPVVQLIGHFSRQKKATLNLPTYAKHTSNWDEIPEADVYLICVSDDAIEEISAKIPFKNKLVLHTSGSKALTSLNSKNRRGVLYPLQTFSKEKEINFNTVPLCLETENEKDYEILEDIAKSLSKNYYNINSEKRKALHVAAVFVCNFVNHLYVLGKELCDSNAIPFKVLHPLIAETAQKIEFMSPELAQTGPAKRNDTQTIESHLAYLQNENQKQIYQLLTQSIQNHVQKL
jgi:predicted short-subunit dehydrogenase-like oxidoreductase (DUF2520 family)